MAGVGALGGRRGQAKGENCPGGRSPLAFIRRKNQSWPSTMTRCHVANIWVTTWRHDTNWRTTVYSARTGIEEAPLCAPISARTARSHHGQKLAVGPAMTRPISCSAQIY